MNTTMNTTTTAATAATDIRVYQDPKSAPTAGAGERVITARFRSPARSATVVIGNDAWQSMQASVPAPYAALLGAVLETAAKSILSKRLEAMTVWPSSIQAELFSADNILTEASGANSEWLSREELAALWDASATRRGFITSPNYQSNKAYRAAVDAYKELVLKLAGKTSQYQEAELDKIVAKLAEADLETELGSFIIKRVEQIRNRPAKQGIDLDIL